MLSDHGDRTAAGPDTAATSEAILDVAESLFYSRGISAVTMRQVRAASGVSLKRLYQEFGSKEDLVTAYLERRNERWLSSLQLRLSQAEPTTPARLEALFGWLDAWFSQPNFNGCAFVNAHGELGSLPDSCREVVTRHLESLREVLARSVLRPAPEESAALPPDADRSRPADPDLTWDLFVIVEGAITTATVAGHPGAARRAGRLAASWWRSQVPGR